eukprot:scaffold101476_cov13-Tisochrysis_lutea.AAC.1
MCAHALTPYRVGLLVSGQADRARARAHNVRRSRSGMLVWFTCLLVICCGLRQRAGARCGATGFMVKQSSVDCEMGKSTESLHALSFTGELIESIIKEGKL